jgi:heptose-I-phosphate ethanolaminephosphotransferase
MTILNFTQGCKTDFLRILKIIAVFILVSFVIRFSASSSKDLFSHYSVVVKTAACVGFVIYIWNYSRKVVQTFVIYSLLYLITACIKLLAGMPLRGEEIVDTFCFANLICALVLLLLRYICFIKIPLLRRFLIVLPDIVTVITVIPAVLHVGYYFISGQMLSASIVLTLFQTNTAEAIGYLKGQNTLVWCLAIFTAWVLILGLLLFINKIGAQNAGKKVCNKTCLCLLLVFSAAFSYLGYRTCSKMVEEEVPAIAVFNQTKETLDAYKNYNRSKETRRQNLTKLKGLTVAPGKGGLFILVIGESETRDHMHAYGYPKENTPWLTEMTSRKQTVLFKNAYSNHTHTVPVLTYALSGKNQYNNLKLSQAYSVIEIAKTAGYKTFWISNQVKFGAWDTPTAVMASTADHEIWINGSVGKSNYTQYYDEELIAKIADLKLDESDNIFIVCHLMGCHGSYQDRYPDTFKKFSVVNKDPDKSISSYDNCVFYNDYILKKIYETVNSKSSFKGMVYLSDHGEEPDTMKSHEASKFTWQMARIPFVMFFSEQFIRESDMVFRTLVNHKNLFWTNDLLYDVLIDIMGIQNAPDYASGMDIASDKYNMDLHTLKTMHGSKIIAEDDRLNLH